MLTKGKRMIRKATCVAAVFLTLAIIGPQLLPRAHSAEGPSAPRSSVLPTGGGQALLDTSDTVILLLDHQSGLFQSVKDIDVAELRRNVVMLARLATTLKIPVITTASEPNARRLVALAARAVPARREL